MRYLCVVTYDGSNYAGWQIQNDAKSIEETIEKVISKILNEETKIFGSGRTDAGVHALGQTFHFDSDKIKDKGKFLYSLNSLLPEDIFVQSINEVSDNFNARLSAIDKTYEYRLNTGKYSVFTRNFEHQFLQKLDIKSMQNAAKLFIGTHSFQNFTSKPEDTQNFVRTINLIDIFENNNVVVFRFNGNGFMRYMVRMIVGTLIQVGLGKLKNDDIKEILDSSERKIVSYKASANGLFLVNVNYGEK